MGKILKLQKRGCDFFKGDPINEQSDVGNYRVYMEFIDKYGVEVRGDLSRGDVYRYNHKVTGKPLKHRVFEHSCGMYDDFCYTAEDGRTFRYRLPDGILDGLRYTQADILKLINQVSKDEYTDIMIVD